MRRRQPADRRSGGEGPGRGRCCSGSREERRAAHVAQCYPGLIDALVIDEADAADADALGVRPIVTKTLMRDATSRRALAEAALDAVALT